jgi:hypothetical protein
LLEQFSQKGERELLIRRAFTKPPQRNGCQIVIGELAHQPVNQRRQRACEA